MAHGRYTIVGKLADGGMAEIFLAMQHGAEGFQKPVVLKRILTAFSADPQFRNMFLDEAHISMSLNHGNIVQVLDVGVAGERTFLVLELVEGWDLGQVMDRARATGPDHPWPPSLALHVTAQICRALSYAHAKRGPDGRPLGIVHRDVSPTNVLISEQGEVKLADFGIAKAERKREQTLAGVIKGKIGFMSPEQALGQPLDARADIFSVGTVMYLMLTGRRPFDSGSELESMMLAQRAEYRPPEELNPYLSPAATEIVNRAMQREPTGRYQTADQMLADVERALRAEYNSAGQTELKLWLDALALRDGALPIGSSRPDESARPQFVDEAGDLSAGSSLELADFDGSVASAPTAVAIRAATPATGKAAAAGEGGGGGIPVGARTPPSRVQPAADPAAQTRSPPSARNATPVSGGPRSGPLPGEAPTSGSPGGLVMTGATAPTATSGTASVTEVRTSSRMPKRSRVGLGFLLGALCMLGAVFGIRWLAHWAGRERSGRAESSVAADNPASTSPPPVASRAPDPPQSPPSSPLGVSPSVPSAPVAAPVAAAVPGSLPRAAEGPSSTAAAPAAQKVPDADASQAAQSIAVDPRSAQAAISDGVVAGGVGGSANGPRAGSAVASKASSSSRSEDSEEDEARLLGRVVTDAENVVGADDAEESPLAAKAQGPRGKGTGKSSQPNDRPSSARKPSNHSARAADLEGAAGAPRGTPAPSARPVQIRITTSPLGAVVRTKKQVLGRTPLAVRFAPGNVYELTFVKTGYVSNNRKLAVLAGKPQSISVAMKRKPASNQRHGFFRGR